ncbi:MAG: DUF349 domain-containing protein [Bacteroides sp.]|jgi:hypothetical protein
MSEQEQTLKVAEATEAVDNASASQEVEVAAEPKEEKIENQTSVSVEEASEPTSSPEPEHLEDATEENESDDDYSELTLPELISNFANVVKDELTEKTRERVTLIQSLFNKKLEDVRQRAHEEWQAIEDHGEETFEAPFRAEEQRFRELMQSYKERRRKHAEAVETERKENLRRKHEIIEKIKALTLRDEVKGETFKEFDALREQWNQIGLVPQADKEDLYMSYNTAVRSFYDYIKINRDLRDLDFKKNLEAKLKLCEQAEDLLKETDIVGAFRKLQELHSLWKEVGPEMPEKREEVWERFSSASAEINARHHKFFENLKEQNEEILAKKTALCDKVEELLKEERSSMQAWRNATDKVKELQKEWKELGYLPNRVVGKVRERFQAACSQIFEGFRTYDRAMRQEGKDNLQKLQDLCAQAEAMKESTDWSATTRAMIDLQKQWQSVGYAPRKRRDELWEKFRGAMDYFFSHRDEAQSSRNKEEKDNLAAKEAILKELEGYEANKTDAAAGVEWLKELQSRWFGIGHVPFKQKDVIQQRYRDLVNRVYKSLGVDRRMEQVEAFKTRIEEMVQGDGNESQLQKERARLRQQIQQLESECSLMSNNLSFFRSSSSSNPLIQQQEEKIASMREDIAMRKNKLKEIDKALRGNKEKKSAASEEGEETKE